MTNEIVVVEEKVSGWTREVLARRAAIVGVVTILLNLALAYGWLGAEVSDDVLKWLSAAFDAATGIFTVIAVRPAVTPVADPKDVSGEPLVPASSVKIVEVAAPPAAEVEAALAAKAAANTPAVPTVEGAGTLTAPDDTTPTV